MTLKDHASNLMVGFFVTLLVLWPVILGLIFNQEAIITFALLNIAWVFVGGTVVSTITTPKGS